MRQGCFWYKKPEEKVTDWNGNALDPAKGSHVVGTNGQVHEEILKLL